MATDADAEALKLLMAPIKQMVAEGRIDWTHVFNELGTFTDLDGPWIATPEEDAVLRAYDYGDTEDFSRMLVADGRPFISRGDSFSVLGWQHVCENPNSITDDE